MTSPTEPARISAAVVLALFITAATMLATGGAFAQVKTPAQLQQEFQPCALRTPPQPPGCINSGTAVQDVVTTFTPIAGSGVPSASAAFIGQVYINTSTNTPYIAKGVGSGAADWLVTTGSGSPATYLNIKVPPAGSGLVAAVGDGTTDDTAAIQAFIDYAYNNHLQAVFCPDGTYKTTASLFLDPPGNLRSNLSSPTIFQFSLAFIGSSHGQGDPSINFGCRIEPTFTDNVALWVGPGQSNRVAGIGIFGQGGYRGSQNPNSAAIGIAGGSGGASHTEIENVFAQNFYSGIKTNANGACCLSESNLFRNFKGQNFYIGFNLTGTQSDINVIENPELQGITYCVSDSFSHTTEIIGGSCNAESGASNAIGISGTSTLFQGGGCTQRYCFTTTLAADDPNIGPVYNSYMIKTTTSGTIPLIMVLFNHSTHAATIGIPSDWVDFYFGSGNVATVLQADIQAQSTLYMAERVTVFLGAGIHAIGPFIENPGACMTLLDTTTVSSGAASDELDDVFLNSDPGQTGRKAATGASLAIYLCQQAFPFVLVNSVNVKLSGGYYSQLFNSEPVNIDLSNVPPNLEPTLTVENLTYGGSAGTQSQTLFAPNMRVKNTTAGPAVVNGWKTLASAGHGFGEFDRSPFLGHGTDKTTLQNQYLTQGELRAPFCGFRPCPWTTPNLPPDLYSLVSGSPGALGSYPLIYSETLYKSINWNSAALTHAFARSASSPGYSYGQNLTNATTGGTVTWSYYAPGFAVYLDSTTMGWMFSGLGISIDNGSGAEKYIVTGVYPAQGYVTVIDASQDSPNLGLKGTNGTLYTCASSCTIGQAAYSWTQYP